MNSSNDIERLLAEIRDLQREHLEEYRRVTQEQLELSRTSVVRQQQIGSLYKRVIFVTMPIVLALLAYLIYIGLPAAK